MLDHPRRAEQRAEGAHGHAPIADPLEAHILRPARPKHPSAVQRHEPQQAVLRRRLRESPVGLPPRIHAARRRQPDPVRARRGPQRRQQAAGLMARHRIPGKRIPRDWALAGVSAMEHADARRMLETAPTCPSWGEVPQHGVLPHRRAREAPTVHGSAVRQSLRGVHGR